MKKYWLAILSILAIITARSQEYNDPGNHFCKTVDYDTTRVYMLKHAMANDSGIYHIPVVFHVFTDANPQVAFPLSKAEKVIEMLNRDFNAKNEDIENVQDEFKGIAANVGFKFHLAKKDNFGNDTDGITYTKEYVPGDNPGCNTTLKMKKNWNSGTSWEGEQHYLQIWITTNVNGEENGSGWTYLPATDNGGKVAGVVYNNRYIGDGSYHMHRVLTHEVGHYFGLNHTFGQNYDTCGDDGIDDTPITKCLVGTCQIGKDLCEDGIVNTENYMDYSNCPKMFSEGQKERMVYWMEDKYRKTLWSEDNLKAAGVWDVVTSSSNIDIPPISVFPNPVRNEINIVGLHPNKPFEIKIYSITGQILKIANNTNPINISNLKNGIYLIRIQSEKDSFVEKIQKSN